MNVWLWIGCICLSTAARPQSVKPLDLQREEVFDYIYKLKVKNNRGQESVLTGFKPAGYAGILTALHGLTLSSNPAITAIRYADASGRSEKIYKKVTLTHVDIANDVAFLSCPELSAKEGLPFSRRPILMGGKTLRIFGFPQINSLKGRERRIDTPPVMVLQDILSDPAKSQLSRRNSPALSTRVLQLEPASIYKGDSGGPILNEFNEVVGVANGGFFNNSGDKITAWAVLISGVPQAPVEVDNRAFRQLVENNVQELMSDWSVAQHRDQYDKETPVFTIGGVLSKPFSIGANGLHIDTDLKNLSGAFDAYAEVKLVNNLMLGGYASSNYLQYRIIRQFDQNIPLQGESAMATRRLVDLYGVQTSLLFNRGLLHQAYVGGGGLYLGNTTEQRQLLNNYRLFIGYRVYLGLKRTFGFEFRAMQLTQNEARDEWQPVLGNATIIHTVKPLTSYYVCAGLTYSVYNRK
ncbi:trypsin-like peptidase domain-containing protein [Spirosoma taeanense]|uniref:Trypsin-like peptidase domain-containing protein n=1 Tax=Spirosoma taeanense TaxID=2735870 RepID=A0A6M5YBE0_9BACT|nr:serine protease [Spirosoma taeanense]QJW90610.1 trypsin-like peptidase domain-containing protein [Spirosoma taeanense]